METDLQKEITRIIKVKTQKGKLLCYRVNKGGDVPSLMA